MQAVKKDVRRGHLYLLKDVLDAVVRNSEVYTDLGYALAEGLERLSKERRWDPTTVLTKSHALFGAMNRVDQYTNLRSLDHQDGRRLRVNLRDHSSTWADACRTWVLDVCGHVPKTGEVTAEAVAQIVKQSSGTKLSTAALLSLSWVSTGRPTTFQYVKKEHLDTTPVYNEENKLIRYDVKITFTHHKLAAKLGALVVPTSLPPEWMDKVFTWMEQTPDSPWLFPMKNWKKYSESVTEALRTVDPTWELRHLRRGSLSTLARKGVEYATLKLFSPHTDDRTLTRYLGGGKNAGANNQRAHEAAELLYQENVTNTSTQ